MHPESEHTILCADPACAVMPPRFNSTAAESLQAEGPHVHACKLEQPLFVPGQGVYGSITRHSPFEVSACICARKHHGEGRILCCQPLTGLNMYAAGISPECLQSSLILWEMLWGGFVLSGGATFFGAFLWMQISNRVLRAKWQVLLLVLLAPLTMLAWWMGGSLLHFHRLVPQTAFYVPFNLTLYGIALCAGLLWPILSLRYAYFSTFRPLLLPFLQGCLGLLFLSIMLFVLMPLFVGSSDAVRVALRLVALPLLTEFCSAAVRLMNRKWMVADVPGVLRGFAMTPMSIAMAFVGRLFTTGMDSLALTVLLSLAVAAVELLLRWTVPQRDACVMAVVRKTTHCCAPCLRWLSRMDNAVQRCCPQGPRPAERLLSSRRRWTDLSPTEQQAKERRAHFAYILGDTVSEDIGMLTLIPVAVLFRLPSRIGGPPLSLGQVLARVGFQYILELWTDVGPFVLYGAGRAYLHCKGDNLYRRVTLTVEDLDAPLAASTPEPGHDQHAHAGHITIATATELDDTHCDAKSLAENPVSAHVVVGTPPAGAQAAPCIAGRPWAGTKSAPHANLALAKSKCVGAAATLPIPAAADACGVQDDSSMTIARTLSSTPTAVIGGKQLLSHEEDLARLHSLSSACHTSEGAPAAGDDWAAVAVEDGRAHPATSASDNGCCSQRAWLLCEIIPDDRLALEHVQMGRTAMLREDSAPWWQRVGWHKVRKAMAPEASPEQWSWLHYAVFRNELLASRISRAWSQRQPGWALSFALMAFFIGGLQLHGYLSTQIVCGHRDSDGVWYWDACDQT